MGYVRRVARTEAVDAGFPHYRVVIAAGGEDATVLGCFLGDGGAPPLHVHDVDLFYFVASGTAQVRLGHGSHQAQAGDLIYIPAGLPHGSDNQSGSEEHHFEILIPGVLPGAPVMRPVKSVDDVPSPGASAVIRRASGPPDEVSERSRTWVLADESLGVRCGRVAVVELAAAGEPGALEKRDSPRVVVVSAGHLDVEIAQRQQSVAAEAVVVIPAGVTHRFWNSSTEPATFLDIEVTAPSAFDRLAPEA